jgi:dephospho-CoA kinase
MMVIIGLTGSIAMGKSTLASMFCDEGLPVYDADQTVHDLLATGGAAAKSVGQAFPETVCEDGSINRSTLGKLVFNEGNLRQKLEQILHPLVSMERDRWLDNYRRDKMPFVVLDIPLLFETGGEKDCDVTVVASSSHYIQKLRALSRGNMTPDQFDSILSLQMPDTMKRGKADFVVPTDFGLTASRWYIRRILDVLRSRNDA